LADHDSWVRQGQELFMSNLMQIVRLAVVATIVVVLVGGAAVEVRHVVAGQVPTAPENARTVFDRDFDFGVIVPVGYCQGVSPGDANRLAS
jgi:hypothetical protein